MSQQTRSYLASYPSEENSQEIPDVRAKPDKEEDENGLCKQDVCSLDMDRKQSVKLGEHEISAENNMKKETVKQIGGFVSDPASMNGQAAQEKSR